jgi:hypothetical protein
VRELLEHNLDLLRFRGNERIDREQLQRLVRVAPEQIRTLVATDGYYSPVVSARWTATPPHRRCSSRWSRANRSASVKSRLNCKALASIRNCLPTSSST